MLETTFGNAFHSGAYNKLGGERLHGIVHRLSRAHQTCQGKCPDETRTYEELRRLLHKFGRCGTNLKGWLTTANAQWMEVKG